MRTSRRISSLRRLERGLTAVNHGIVLITMVVVLVFLFGEAVDRYLLKTSFNAHEQIAKIGLVWLVFAGTAAAYARRENLRIDLFRKHLSPAALRRREALFEIATLLVCALVNVKAWSVLEVAGFQQILGTPFTNVVPYSAIVLGTAAIALSCVVRLIVGPATEEDPR
ncbi:MAG: TRAP transporter small permease subunit [Burkholderiales bacterium]|nr:TRAP transporter small permease subunit [Burkholderiales bacterium]